MISLTSKLPLLICLIVLITPTTESIWLFQDQSTPSNETSSTRRQQQQLQQQQQSQDALQQVAKELDDEQSQPIGQQIEPLGEGVTGKPAQQAQGSYYSSLMSIAGIQPASLASLFNTVGDTGFRYFNIHDQCRNRAACDLGFMFYKKLSFVHNWLIRTSVRSLTDINNVYTQSWMEGMLGRNCTFVYPSCRQSPLEGLMGLAVLQHLAQ